MSREILFIAAGAAALTIIAVVLNFMIMRHRYISFTQKVYESLDCIMQEQPVDFNTNEETLDSKLIIKLVQLQETYQAFRMENLAQKEEIQKMVSDISHQLKTPIANIGMYSEMALEHELPVEKQRECLEILRGQVEKLEFLVQALVKMSRLENHVICLKKEKENLYRTLMETIQDIKPKADTKNIRISLVCEQVFPLHYDEKWTGEAIFNLLENAVKYTPESGEICVTVQRLELYTRITVEDTGIGIGQDHLNDIWKRFYREQKVHKKPGIGIGLFLTKTIIMLQGGYVKVHSKEGKGSRFFFYLPNDYPFKDKISENGYTNERK